MTDLEDLDRRLRETIATIPAEARALLLRVLTSEPEPRAKEIGNLHTFGLAPATVELLIDAEEDPALRAVLIGMLREIEQP